MDHCWRSKNKILRDIILWTLPHGSVSVVWPKGTYQQQLCMDVGSSLEDLTRTIGKRESGKSMLAAWLDEWWWQPWQSMGQTIKSHQVTSFIPILVRASTLQTHFYWFTLSSSFLPSILFHKLLIFCKLPPNVLDIVNSQMVTYLVESEKMNMFWQSVVCMMRSENFNSIPQSRLSCQSGTEEIRHNLGCVCDFDFLFGFKKVNNFLHGLVSSWSYDCSNNCCNQPNIWSWCQQ